MSASHRRPRAVRALLVLLLIAHAPRGLAQEPALVAAPWQVQGILSALGAMEARDQIPSLVTLLANANPDTRCAAAKALGHLKATDRIPELVVLLNDLDSGARWGAVEGLEKQRPISAGLMAGSTPRDSRDRTVDAAARFNCHYLTGGNPAACLAALEPAPWWLRAFDQIVDVWSLPVMVGRR